MHLALTRLARLAGLALLLTLAGCGTDGTPVDDGKSFKDLTLASPAPTQQKFDSEAFTRQVLTEVTQARDNARTLSFDVSGYFVDFQGKVGSNKTHFWFERPNKTAIKVLESTDKRTVGTKLVWLGGSKMTVHTQFVGFWITTDVDVHDPRATDHRGYFMDETGLANTIATFLDPKSQLQFKGFGQLNGSQIAQFEVRSPRMLKGITREIFTIDGRSKLPVVREMYDATNTLVFRIRMENVEINPTLAKDTFVAK